MGSLAALLQHLDDFEQNCENSRSSWERSVVALRFRITS